MSEQVINQELRIASNSEHLKEIRDRVEEICAQSDIEEDQARLLVLAVDEAVTNIVHHAQDTDRDGEVVVQIDINEVRFRAHIEDYTNGQTPEVGDQDIREHLEESRRHKLGIFLMQCIMDEISYNYKKGYQNELEMIHFLNN